MNSKTTFKKGLYSLVLLLFALFVSFVMSNHAYAADSDFVVDENGVLTKYTGFDSYVVIPEKVNGIKVNSIGKGAFDQCSELISVKLPDNITSIGDSAFAFCENLKSIDIPNSVTSIGGFVFIGCENLKTVDLPNLITSIDSYLFNSCTNLESVNIPNSVTSIRGNAFAGCESLKTIDIPNSVTSIGYYAFAYCNSFVSVNIPNSVTSIGDYAFTSCKNLKTVNLPNFITSIGSSLFSRCTNLESIKIPDSVTSIGDSAFYFCDSLKTVDLPNFITSIGRYAFCHCINLESVNIPNSVTSIGDSAFASCENLKTVDIPNFITSIGSSLFSSCTNLESVNIPNSVTSIGDEAFAYCKNLKSIDIPNSVTSIGSKGFCDCSSLKSINIPISVISIGGMAFFSCDSLETIVINNDTVRIDSLIINTNRITLYGNKNSSTERYAKERHLKFRVIGEIPLTAISLQKTSINLTVGKTSLNSVIYNPDNTTDDKTVTWTSSNKSVATVAHDGVITGVSSGSAIVKAKVGTLTATCKVTVKDDSKPKENKIYFTDDYKDKTVTKDETIRIPVKLSTIKDYYALDSSIKYDKIKLEFLGYSIKENYKDCYADSSDVNTLRFILASKGKNYPIKTSDDPIIYLNFKCIAIGDANVTITSTTLANLDEEVAIKTDNLDKTTIHITESSKPSSPDINKDGKFSLIDLAIDAYYYGVDADETDKTKYDADIIPDGKIDDLDLMEITKNIINNK